MEFFRGKRGGRMVLYNNFKYNYARTNKKDGSTHWKCASKKCKAKLCTDQNNSFTSTSGEHNHDANDKSDVNRQTKTFTNDNEPSSSPLSSFDQPSIKASLRELQEMEERLQYFNTKWKNYVNSLPASKSTLKRNYDYFLTK